MKDVASSTVARYAYDADHFKLYLEFKSGKVYRYEGVAPIVVDDFEKAPSKGQFFNQSIKGKFSGALVDLSEVPAIKDGAKVAKSRRKRKARAGSRALTWREILDQVSMPTEDALA